MRTSKMQVPQSPSLMMTISRSLSRRHSWMEQRHQVPATEPQPPAVNRSINSAPVGVVPPTRSVRFHSFQRAHLERHPSRSRKMEMLSWSKKRSMAKSKKRRRQSLLQSQQTLLHQRPPTHAQAATLTTKHWLP